MNSVELKWRLQRLSKMSASEVRWRVSEQVRRRRWASRQVSTRGPASVVGLPSPAHEDASWKSIRDPQFRAFPSGKMRQAYRARYGEESSQRPTRSWRGDGTSWESRVQDMEDPDWFFDPITGRRAPQVDYCFKVNHRSEDVTGNVKQIWELSRMHHLTVLAAAFSLPATNATPNVLAAASPFLVDPEPLPLGHSLDERNRGRDTTDHLGLGASLARRVGGMRRSLRAQSRWHGPKSGGICTTSFLPQSGIVRQQSCHRRGRRPTGRGTCV